MSTAPVTTVTDHAPAPGPTRTATANHRVAPYNGAMVAKPAPSQTALARAGPRINGSQRAVPYILDVDPKDFTLGDPTVKESVQKRKADHCIKILYKGFPLPFDGFPVYLTKMTPNGALLCKLIGDAAAYKDATTGEVADRVNCPISLSSFVGMGAYQDARGTAGLPMQPDETSPITAKLELIEDQLKTEFLKYRTNPALLEDVNPKFSEEKKGKRSFLTEELFGRTWNGTGKQGGSWMRYKEKGVHLELQVFKHTEENPNMPIVETAEIVENGNGQFKIADRRIAADGVSYRDLLKHSVVHTQAKIMPSIHVGGMGAGLTMKLGTTMILKNLGGLSNEQAAVDFGGMEVEDYLPQTLYKPMDPMGYLPANEDDAQTVVGNGHGNGA